MNDYFILLVPLAASIFLVLILAPQEFRGRDAGSLILSVVGVIATIVMVGLIPEGRYFGGAILVTAAGKMLAYLVLGFAALAFLSTAEYLHKIHVPACEWRLTVLFIALGAVNLCFAEDLITIFVAFELLSIPAYALVGFSRRDGRSNEAGMKYLILGILGSAFFLLGIVLLYGASGQIFLTSIKESLAAAQASAHANPTGIREMDYYRLALGAFLASLFFKLGVAPFHGWLFDVYKGSSYAALSIVGVAAKLAGFALAYRILRGAFDPLRDTWMTLISLGAIASFLFGGLQGIRQDNVKRMLAASSVMSAGFVMLALGGDERQFVFYLFTYAAATLAMVAAFQALGTRAADIDSVHDLSGLGTQLPLVAGILTLAVVSQAGVPLTAGFLAKFGVLYSVFQSPELMPRIAASAGVIGSVLSFYFYFRIVRVLWFEPEFAGVPRETRIQYVLVAGSLSFALLFFGIFPSAFPG